MQSETGGRLENLRDSCSNEKVSKGVDYELNSSILRVLKELDPIHGIHQRFIIISR